jgi:murein DD-endopeptidase MepM/ murein hydrolase activator NlpD
MFKKNKRRFSSSSRRRGGLGRKILLLLLTVIIAGGAAAGYILFETEKPQVTIDSNIKYLGGPVKIPFVAADQRSGIQQVVVTLEQDGAMYQLFNKSFPRQSWLSKAGPEKISESITLDARHAGARDGKAELVFSVHDFSLNGMFKGNVTEVRYPVSIDTKPPRIDIFHAQKYIRPGGSGIVVYSLSEPAEKHGVMIGDTFFQGYPLKGSDKNFIAYIALPWNATKPENTRVIAVDQAGNTGKAVFSMRFKKVKEKKDRINVSDGFLNRKIPEFEQHYPEISGSKVEKYIYVNNKVRTANAEKIAEICSDTSPDQLWHDRFVRMPGAGRAGFADQRTYYYQGKPIDHQTHLGMDIASTARVAIKAANSGRIIHTDYLGIYGNTVIIDHGQGVSSLYSHLSRIDTTLGKMVEKEEVIGHSGATGMAGGDHLHFSILVHGIFVTPVEWWDQHWIDVNINNVINDINVKQ